MIRWKYVAPRAALLLSVWCVVSWGLDPFLRWSLIRIGQGSTGARVDITELSSAISSGLLQIDGIAIADRKSPQKNLLEARVASLQLDTGALMQRRFVISDGRISGIRMGTVREQSGALIPTTTSQTGTVGGGNLQDKLESLGKGWLDGRSQQLQKDLENSFDSVRVARELGKRWPQRYSQMESDVQDVSKETEALVAMVKQTSDNPLRALELYQDFAVRADSLRKRTQAVREGLSQFRDQIGQDKKLLEEAKRHDEELIRQHANLETISPEAISEYLLGRELAAHVSTATDWVQWFRHQFPAKEAPAAAPVRGEDIVFRGMPNLPKFLIRHLAVEGEGILGNEPVKFVGEMSNVTNQLAMSDAPMTLHAQTQGTILAELHAVRETEGENIKDRVVINCLRFPLPERKLGDQNQLSLIVSEGHAHIWSQLEIANNDLKGELRLKQEGVSMRTGSVPVHLASFQNSVDQVASSTKDLEVLVQIDGSPARPHVRVVSNLGPQLAQAVRHVAQQEVTRRAETLVQASQKEIDQQLANFESKLLAEQQQLLGKLKIGDEQIQKLTAEVADRMGISKKYFSAEKIIDNILRR
ncbi:MAG: TIGR03545 family protein [Planctomycetota bacterium]|nr:TIGR03545 family protein [Planctomycetota bacterium]MDA1177625.1 TIGR03545 family protein [Planctomycetota bacterium]